MTTVYLADLRHNYGGVLATDCMPIGVGYMKAVMDRDLPDARSRLFAYPDRLMAAMKENPPDVLMVSNYVWNEAISLFFARLGKRLNPEMLVVMGGPNIPVEPERQVEFVAKRPEVDLYIVGEADFIATQAVRLFLEAGRSVRQLGAAEIPSSVYRRPNAELYRTETWERRRNVDDIPSPWLTGIMDEFFDGKLAPMIETNRGCPFRCTFCVQGTGFYNKINDFGMERLKDEIDYIGRRIQERSPTMGTLRIADANYGMYERDVDISAWIGEAQKKYGWPTFIDATTGKNRPERIIQSMEKVNGALVLYQAVQSLDEGVLRNIKRSNIKLAAYEQIQVHVRGRGLKSNSDLILGLPGESYRSHVDAVFKLVDAGTNQMHCFQAMMLKGSEMEMVESRTQFQFDTRFRVLPKNFGVYDDEKVFDIEEIIVGTDTLSFDDYLEARKLHMTFSVFWNDGWFGDVVDFLVSCGVKRSEWLWAMLQAMQEDRGRVRAFLDSFVEETRNELFPTREACTEFYAQPENFPRLLAGEIGDNLMYRYRAIASFPLWREVCRLAMEATKKLIVARGIAVEMPELDSFWRDFHRYVELKHAHGDTPTEVLAPVRTALRHDIPRWLGDGAPRDTRPYAVGPAETFEFRLTEEGSREMEAAFKVWTYQIKGLSKMVTRIRVASQVRECRRLPAGAPVLGA
ncbi:MAG: radical SAM protein [Planctomycetes bacterium]|nr:radical SAM protein [Planctomycetota bacterium]